MRKPRCQKTTYVHGPIQREPCVGEKLEGALEIIAGIPPARSFADESQGEACSKER